MVEQFQSYAYSLAFRLVLNEDNAKDIVQESFIRIWRHISNYDSNILFTTWLYKIVTNLCYDNLKSSKRRNNAKLNREQRSDQENPAAFEGFDNQTKNGFRTS